ncbi:hypothetical protein JMJ35_006059 [Cladonia borealis]|uniref:HAUS augmin-like complex subunit 6 N-terminal domain-containing protein n=1 Tax=Cladonia borealis TaxID=184061 RepID=A0AA39QZX5_9LECA|nr:hypothetical protein JMJ35_006059 [Cladonia borealis]
MSKPQAPPASPHATSSLSVFLTNVHLLDLDRCEDWPAISAQTFISKNTLQNEKNRIKCAEWAFYRLFELWDPEETKDKLQPFFPPLEPLQSLNLRAALFRCLNELKKNGDLGKETIMRKSMFDDCKGEKLQELLASLSTVVLRKVLAAGDAGKVSIAGRLAIAKQVTAKEHESLLPLAIAHRASLTGLLRRKKELRARYQSFSCTLSAKEKELDKRFEAVVQTQEFLDENKIPDNMVSRLSTLFEKHWQGNPDLATVVTQGEEHGLRDSLLERPFQDVWPEVSSGNFDGKSSTIRQGLLQDLERRVANQESRLNQWKDFKEAIQRDTKPKVVSQAQDLSLTRSTSNEQEHQKRRERDLVFSPRKSPRKSDWELKKLTNETSPTPAMPETPRFPVKPSTSSSRHFSVVRKAGEEDQGPEAHGRDSLDHASLSEPSCNGSHNSSFSEVSGSQLHEIASPDNAVRFTNGGTSSTIRVEADDSAGYEDRDGSRSKPPIEPVVVPTRNVISSISDGHSETRILDEDDVLAEKIISMTLNAAPTPAKPKLSLAERTRQSIAFASPSKIQGLRPDGSSPPHAPAIATEEMPQSDKTTSATTTTTLLERTRQSISLLPSNPKPQTSRKSSMHERRSSKIYPTNPFETPRKQASKMKGLTPPEELFTPGAGYDSVFKSRPKVAFSPAASPSPSPGLEEGEAMDGAGDGSPSSRGVGRV